VKNKRLSTVTLIWQDNSNNETGFLIQRADDPLFKTGVANSTVGVDVATFSENVARGATFYYRVHAFSDTSQSGWSNLVMVTTP
jgi:hypothetical protein